MFGGDKHIILITFGMEINRLLIDDLSVNSKRNKHASDLRLRMQKDTGSDSVCAVLLLQSASLSA